MAEIEYTFRPFTVWPREDTRERQARSPFSAPGKPPEGQNWAPRKAIPLSRSMRELGEEVIKLKGRSPFVIQINLSEKHIRADGGLRSDAPKPKHPGVIVSFTGKHGALKYLCDHFAKWEDNLRAIVLTLQRLRLIDLYGVTSRGEQYTGWRALPNLITPPPMSAEEAANFLHQHGQDQPEVILKSDENFRRAYRAVAAQLHPDAGGNPAEWEKLQQAKEVLQTIHGPQ